MQRYSLERMTTNKRIDSIVDVDKVKRIYTRYRSRVNIREDEIKWKYCNEILYSMCKDRPFHDDPDKIASKLLIIGRTYAAAIERRYQENPETIKIENDSFYYEVVVPALADSEEGKELDEKVQQLRESNNSIREDIGLVLETHSKLTEIFSQITKLNKRSLASKYLHFHCPEKFFIYDSRVDKRVKKLVNLSKTYLPELKRINVKKYDDTYAKFVWRMLELQRFLEEEIQGKDKNDLLLPRDLDDFLLSNTFSNWLKTGEI